MPLRNKLLLAALAVAALAASGVLVYTLCQKASTSAPPPLSETIDLSALTDPSKLVTITWVNDSDIPIKGTLVGAGENIRFDLNSSMAARGRSTVTATGPFTIEELRIERGEKKTSSQPKAGVLAGSGMEIHVSPDDSVRLVPTPK
jgi:hypothetical protein